MKNSLIIILSVTFLLACKKESVEPPIPEKLETEAQKEQIIHAVENYEWGIRVGIVDRGLSTFYNYHQEFNFRLKPGFMHENKAFYNYQKKSEYSFPNDDDLENWTDIPGLYRYDFDNKISYLYADVNDANPKILMDFNRKIGDTILIEDKVNVVLANAPVDIFFVVKRVLKKEIDGVVLPALEGAFCTSHPDIIEPRFADDIFIYPLYPNPIIIDGSFQDYTSYDWDAELGRLDLIKALSYEYRLKYVPTDFVIQSFALRNDW